MVSEVRKAMYQIIKWKITRTADNNIIIIKTIKILIIDNDIQGVCGIEILVFFSFSDRW